ncbi:MAG: CAP domain-containing protein [Acidimicrobiales bacterium]
MSSTQRSRAIAALVSLVTLLAVAALLGNVVSGTDTEGSGVNLLTPAGAADLQINAADLRIPGSTGVTTWRFRAPRYRASVPRPGRPRPVITTMTSPTTEAPNSPALPPAGPTPTTAKVVTTASRVPSSMVTTPSTASTSTPKPPPPVMPPPSAPATAPTSVVTVPTTPTTAKPTTTTTATTAPTTSSTVVTQPPPTSGAMSGVELEVARMTNELRTNPNGPLARKKAAPSCVQVDGNGKVVAVPALTVSEAVSVNLSRTWSMDMNSRNTMDHRSSASALAIYNQLGISPRTYGENVAWFQGYSDAQAAQVLFEGWRESDGHYCNMMSASYTSFGVGVYKGSSRTWGTQNFYATR